jgi:hypothetical protein
MATFILSRAAAGDADAISATTAHAAARPVSLPVSFFAMVSSSSVSF